MKLQRALTLSIVSLAACAGSGAGPSARNESPSKPAESASNHGTSAAAIPAASAAPSGASSAVPERTESDATASGSEPLKVSVSKAHADGKHYALDAKAPAAVKLGATGEIEIALEAKDGYHTNDKYPFKLTPAAEPAALVIFDKKELSRADGTFSKSEAKFKVKFKGAESGTAKLGGLLAFSVCTAKECIVDKIELTVPVTIR